MYQVQDKPDDTAQLTNGGVVTPLVTLKDEHGGVSHIIMDDHCYVLVNERVLVDSHSGHSFEMTAWWYREAALALAALVALTEEQKA